MSIAQPDPINSSVPDGSLMKILLDCPSAKTGYSSGVLIAIAASTMGTKYLF